MHVGHPGNVDIKYTVTRRRSVSELLSALPADADERAFFEGDELLRSGFPEGTFNCWGVPSGAKPRFSDTDIGDLILFVPLIGIHGGGVHQLGLVKAKCPVAALNASAVLWPATPHERLYPWLMFFDTEVGYREWFDFLEDVGYSERWNPQGWYRKIDEKRLKNGAGRTDI